MHVLKVLKVLNAGLGKPSLAMQIRAAFAPTISFCHDVGEVNQLDEVGSHVPAGGVPEFVPQVLQLVRVATRRHDSVQICNGKFCSIIISMCCSVGIGF